MGEQYGVVVDLDRCVGCHACEIACKQENQLPEGTRWIHVVQVGPEKVGGRLRMEFVPFMLDGCNLRGHRVLEGLKPACVTNCPTKALEFCDAAEVLRLLGRRRRQVGKVLELRGRGR